MTHHPLLASLALSLLVTALLACDDDPATEADSNVADASGTDATGTDTTTADGTQTDSGATSQPVSVAFEAVVGDSAAACDQSYDLGTPVDAVQIKDFRLYVSVVQLHATDGDWVDVALTDDGQWQLSNVALLDFETGTGACSETGNADTHTTVDGTVPTGSYDGLRFTLGIPFDLNHQDTTSAPTPFNLGAMFWNWQAGYKFARIDLVNSNDAPNNAWHFHLGSTMCVSDSAVTPPGTECARSNRLAVEFDGFDSESNAVQIDLAAFLDDIDVTTNTMDTPPGCQSSPPDAADCTPVFENLGLDFETGDCATDCSDQQLFQMVTAE